MNWLAWRMLIGDRTKYWGIVFGVAFGSLLIAQQSAIFVGLMRRTSSRIIDVTEADIWVMDKQTLNVDEVRPMPENRLYQVRGVPGVDWAVRLYKGQVVVRTEDGGFRQDRGHAIAKCFQTVDRSVVGRYEARIYRKKRLA